MKTLLFKGITRMLWESESESHSVVSDSLRSHGLYSPLNSPGQHTGVGNLSLLQGIFPTQGLNQGLPHCKWILYQLGHQGSPRILGSLFPSPADVPDSGIEPGSPALRADSLPTELSGKLCHGEGNGSPLQYSCLENPMDRRAWWATAQRVIRSWTQAGD